MENNKLKIEYVDISKLKENEYNPKKMSEVEAKNLEKSITEFGIVDPLIVNKAKGREGIIIGGHQRFKIYKKLKIKEVPVVWLDIPDLRREQELCLRLSKSVGSWDLDLLTNFDEELLKNIGWEEEELMAALRLNEIDNFKTDFDRYNVLMIDPPGKIQIKERLLLKCKNRKDYDLIKKFIIENGGDKLLEQILNIVK